MAAANQPPGLTDTDILIDAARRLPQTVQYVSDQQAGGALQISVVSAMELISGCRDKLQLTQVQQFLDSVRVLPVTEAISQIELQLMQSFRLSHGLLLPDALIGATCLDHGLPLRTKNVRHFQMISGLTVQTPY